MKTGSHEALPELLAPAGTLEHLRAAVNAGADAVYVGGKKWGARANAGNFDDEEMKQAVDYCHMRDVKLYVTMNTLVFDNEIEDAVMYAAFLYEIGVDALIVQDWGLASVLKRLLPDFHIHLSTQGSVYSLEGVRAAAEIGLERVVLAREVSVSDMKAIHEACGVELEVFVHGALCFCYSGQCQLSRFRGGRSGNRGMCAQPCRLPYKYETAGGAAFKYPLSPKDLCGIASLGDLIDAGISSLKIEGRMKSPEYVAVVVSVYRKYLDMYADLGYCSVTEEDRRRLNQVFNRGGFTQGYYYSDPGDRLMSGNVPKHQGVKIGHVMKRSKRELAEVVIDKNKALNMGDGIEIRNDEMPGNVVTYIKELTDKNHLLIGDIRGNINPGDEIYKLTDKTLMDEAAMYYALDKDGKERMVKRVPVDMYFSAYVGGEAQLTVYSGDKSVTVFSDMPAEHALHKPLTAERAAEQLGKTGGSVFGAVNISCDIGDNVSLPMAQINKLRRDALEELGALKINAHKHGSNICFRSGFIEYGCDEQLKNEKLSKNNYIYIYAHAVDSESRAEIRRAIEDITSGVSETRLDMNIKVLVPLKSFMECGEEAKEYQMLAGDIGAAVIVPYTYNISMGDEDEYIRSNFEKIICRLRASDCEIVCGNIGWLKAFADAGVRTAAGYGLNVTNRQAEMFLLNIGAEYTLPSLECIDTDVYDGGAVPLMITEHMMDETMIVGKNNDRYMVLKNDYGSKSLLCKCGKYKKIYILQ